MAAGTRRGHGDDSIYFDASKNRWIGATSLGHSVDGQHRIRHKVRGRTKAEVREKLKALRQELEAELQPSASCTVRACVEDWLATGLTAVQAETVENYSRMAEHAIASLGAVRLKSLTARHVRSALEDLAPSLSTRSLRLVHQALERSITHAQAGDLVARNVAALVAVPKGRVGRPSKSLTLEQATRALSARR
jgi:hypothetical protein